MKKGIFVILILFFGLLFPKSAAGQESTAPRVFSPPEIIQEPIEGKVLEVLEEKTLEFSGSEQLYQKLKILITKGSNEGEEIIFENGKLPTIESVKYEQGDELVMLRVEDPLVGETYYVSDYVRRTHLLWLFIIFVVTVLIISKAWGFASILGLFYSFFVILKFILPKILSGSSPLFIAIVGAMIISPVTFFISHGLNKKTYVALVSTFIALTITGILAGIFINLANLGGFGSEEAYFLQIARQGQINMQGLLLAGIIIGTLGVLDDVTITQASIVAQLKHTNSKLNIKETFTRAMQVGHDHIASTVNTLVLVYTGASLPLLLLFINSGKTFSEVINSQILAEEVVSTLVGSIGLILSVPITTYLAAHLLTEEDGGTHAGHVH